MKFKNQKDTFENEYRKQECIIQQTKKDKTIKTGKRSPIKPDKTKQTVKVDRKLKFRLTAFGK